MSAEVYRWRCNCCGEDYEGLPTDLAFDPPFTWESFREAGGKDTHIDDDFCALFYENGSVDRFIRCIMTFHVHELGNDFRLGVWVSVSENSWNVYAKGFNTGVYGVHGCFGYLMHEIPEFPGSALLHLDVHFRDGQLRPEVFLQDSDHPLVAVQREGVSVTQVQRWVATTHS